MENFKELTKDNRRVLEDFSPNDVSVEQRLLRGVLKEYAQKNTYILKKGDEVLYQPTRWDYVTCWFNNKKSYILGGLIAGVGIITARYLLRNRTLHYKLINHALK